MASELGADVVKVRFPHPEKKKSGTPAPYTADFSAREAIDAAGQPHNGVVSGGVKAGDEAMLEKARLSMAAGATGLIIWRNVWQREHDESLRFTSRSTRANPTSSSGTESGTKCAP